MVKLSIALGAILIFGVAYLIAHVTPVQLLLALGLLVAMWAGVRRLRQRAASRTTAGAGERVDLPLPSFARLTSSLERRGIVRDKAEPLERFARRLDESGLKDAAKLVERYAALRYGGRGEQGKLEEEMDRFQLS